MHGRRRQSGPGRQILVAPVDQQGGGPVRRPGVDDGDGLGGRAVKRAGELAEPRDAGEPAPQRAVLPGVARL